MIADKKTVPELEVCPVCGLIPNLGYCCGEYMVSCLDPYCPVGGNKFTEMHSSEQMEIDAWNKRVRAFRMPGRIYCGGCDFTRPNDMRCMCGDSQWAGVPVKRDNYCRHGMPRIESE